MAIKLPKNFSVDAFINSLKGGKFLGARSNIIGKGKKKYSAKELEVMSDFLKKIFKTNPRGTPDLSTLKILNPRQLKNLNPTQRKIYNRKLALQQNNKKISVVKKDKTGTEIAVQQNKTSSSNNAAKLNKNFAKLRERSRNAEKIARIKEAEKLAKLKAAEKLKDKKLQIANQSKDKKPNFNEVYKNQQIKNINKVDPKVNPKVNTTFTRKDNKNALVDKIIRVTKNTKVNPKVNNSKVNNSKVNNNKDNKYTNFIKKNKKKIGFGAALLTAGGAKLLGDGEKNNKNNKNIKNDKKPIIKKPINSNVKIETLPKLKSNDYTGRFIDKNGDVAYDSASDFLSHMFGTPMKRAMPKKSARIVGTGNTLKRKVADTKGAGKGVMFTTKRTGGSLSSSSKVVAKQVKGWGKARKPRG